VRQAAIARNWNAIFTQSLLYSPNRELLELTKFGRGGATATTWVECVQLAEFALAMDVDSFSRENAHVHS
jgi:hypothetical protein